MEGYAFRAKKFMFRVSNEEKYTVISLEEERDLGVVIINDLQRLQFLVIKQMLGML